ncbi:MAG: restriction endonuclease subunit S [Spirochaetes bacterium]|nr:restriction endonuclease subunit S [Spirochaetota bacterium]
MGGEWRSSTWGEEISLEYGKALRGHEDAQGRYRVFGANGPIGWTSQPLVQGPGVILGRKGAYRGVQFSRDPFFVIDTAYYVVPKREINMRWLYYATIHYKLGEVDDGSPIPSTTRAAVYVIDLDVPPLDEQHAVAHILGTLDDKIELNRRLSETLEAIARALFKSWFVDFDPVRAKAEGWNAGLPKPLADLFPARLVDSELGEIPEGWEVGTLADMSALNQEVWSKLTRPSEIRYVDLSNTKWGRIEAISVHLEADAPSRAQRVLRPRDTIVGTVRPGNGSYAFIAEDGLTGSTGFAVLRPARPEYAEVVYLAATARENIEALSRLSDGGAYPAVRFEVVAATQVVRSTDQVVDRFARVTGPLFAKMSQNERESRTLAALRDTLLPKLISGELRVHDAERLIRRLR